MKWRQRPIIPNLDTESTSPYSLFTIPPLPSLPYLRLSAHVLSGSPPRMDKPDDSGGDRGKTVVVHRVHFDRLICVGSTEREGALVGSLSSLSLSLSQPFSASPILQSFPRGVERATERWGRGRSS